MGRLTGGITNDAMLACQRAWRQVGLFPRRESVALVAYPRPLRERDSSRSEQGEGCSRRCDFAPRSRQRERNSHAEASIPTPYLLANCLSNQSAITCTSSEMV